MMRVRLESDIGELIAPSGVLTGVRKPDDSRLHPIIKNCLARRNPSIKQTEEVSPYWSANYFGLNQSGFFNGMSCEQQELVLRECSQSLLEEAYYIEKSGSHYTAKMALLSETTEEKMLYGLIAADEMAHLYSVQSYLYRKPAEPDNQPFLKLLEEIIENGQRLTLVFVLQVVLEGWGITHYRSLRDGCGNQDLKKAFDQIIVDEYKHHGSGVVLLEEGTLSKIERDEIEEALIRFLQMVSAGPLGVMGAVEKVGGGLTHTQRKRLLEDLDGVSTTQLKLNTLKRLITHQETRDISERLEARGAFVAAPQLTSLV